MVATTVQRPKKAQAPTGSGCITRPRMVLRNTENRVQASGVMPAGAGSRNFTAHPNATATAAGTSLMGCSAGAAGAAGCSGCAGSAVPPAAAAGGVGSSCRLCWLLVLLGLRAGRSFKLLLLLTWCCCWGMCALFTMSSEAAKVTVDVLILVTCRTPIDS